MSRFNRAATAAGVCALVAAGGAGAASAGVINFDGKEHGRVIDTEYLASKGVLISTTNFQGGPDLAVAFDTRRIGTADPDLEDPWTVGNLAPGNGLLEKVLIIAENDRDRDGDGFIDSPDDQGAAPADGSSGEITFRFSQPLASFGLDLIDVDGDDDYGADLGFIAFLSGGAEVARAGFGEFVTPASPFYDRTVVYGDRSANRIAPMSAADLGAQGFDQVIVNMGLCLAIDNIQYATLAESSPSVPEPAAAVTLLAPLALLARQRSKR